MWRSSWTPRRRRACWTSSSARGGRPSKRRRPWRSGAPWTRPRRGASPASPKRRTASPRRWPRASAGVGVAPGARPTRSGERRRASFAPPPRAPARLGGPTSGTTRRRTSCGGAASTPRPPRSAGRAAPCAGTAATAPGHRGRRGGGTAPPATTSTLPAPRVLRGSAAGVARRAARSDPGLSVQQRTYRLRAPTSCTGVVSTGCTCKVQQPKELRASMVLARQHERDVRTRSRP
mmetsp:Transcript_126124/g.353150  ORF Transcript_126124/g.353150 Transcript_126124/m.353150 type:complete len:234 (+) Transcript_126124:643-1344(+)